MTVGINLGADDLGLPRHAREVESDPDPDGTLKRVLASRTRRPRLEVDDILIPLAERISLERLGAVPAYQPFVSDMTAMLRTLNVLENRESR